MRLNDEILFKASRKARSYKIYDGKGLYVEVPPTGNLRWRYKFRFDGKEKRLSLGIYPDTPIYKAREAHQEMIALLKQGINPSIERQEKRLCTKVAKEADHINALAQQRNAAKAKLKEAYTYVATLKQSILALRNELRIR